MADPFDSTGTEQAGSPDVWRNLMAFGLATMAAGSQPGATTMGALGKGGLSAMDSARQNASARSQIQGQQANTAGSNLSNASALQRMNMQRMAYGQPSINMPGVPNLPLPMQGVQGQQQGPGQQGSGQQTSGGNAQDQAQMAGNAQSAQNDQLGDASSSPQAGSVGPSWGPTMGSAPNQNQGQISYLNGNPKGVNFTRVNALAQGTLSAQQATADEISQAASLGGPNSGMLQKIYEQHMQPQTLRGPGSGYIDPLQNSYIGIPEFREEQGAGGRQVTNPKPLGIFRQSLNGGPPQPVPDGGGQGAAGQSFGPQRQSSLEPPTPQGTDNAGMPIMPGTADVDPNQAQQFAQANQAPISRAQGQPNMGPNGAAQPSPSNANGGGLGIMEPKTAPVPTRGAPQAGNGEPDAFVSKLGPGEDEQIKELAKNFTNSEHGGELHTYNNALQMQGTIKQLRSDLGQMSQSDWLTPGANGDTRIGIANGINTLNSMTGGKGDVVDPNSLNAGIAASKIHTILGAQATNQYFGASHEAASIITSMTAANPGPNIPGGANNTILNGQEEAANYAKDLYEFKQKYSDQNNGDLRGADTSFNQMFPPQKYAMRAISQDKPIPVNNPAAVRQLLPGTRFVVRMGNGQTTQPKMVPGQDMGTGGDQISQQLGAQ